MPLLMFLSERDMREEVRRRLLMGEEVFVVARTTAHGRVILNTILPTLSHVVTKTAFGVRTRGGGVLYILSASDPSLGRGRKGPFYVQVSDNVSEDLWQCHPSYPPTIRPKLIQSRFERILQES